MTGNWPPPGSTPIDPYAEYSWGPRGRWHVSIIEWQSPGGGRWGFAFIRWGKWRADREAVRRIDAIRRDRAITRAQLFDYRPGV